MANRPTIPPKTVTRLWLAAGGRCEYPGCNKPLWRDDLTMKRLNQSYIAHILGVNPESARWDEVRSQQLVKEFSNLMLLCDVCHNRVDKAERDAHDEALLARYKREHETRIELLTGLTPERRTQLVMFGANIADGKGLVNYRRAADAVLPDRYPVDGSGITLDLTRGGLTDDHPLYWDTVIGRPSLSPHLHEDRWAGGRYRFLLRAGRLVVGRLADDGTVEEEWGPSTAAEPTSDAVSAP